MDGLLQAGEDANEKMCHKVRMNTELKANLYFWQCILKP
jgi:hypothetical protein